MSNKGYYILHYVNVQKIIKVNVVVTGKTPEISTETHHKAQQNVINEDQPICKHFSKNGIDLFSTTALSLNSNLSAACCCCLPSGCRSVPTDVSV